MTAVSALILDLWTKTAVFSWVWAQPDLRVTLIPGRFEFLARYNEAGVWSIGHSSPHSNTILAVIGVAIIGLVFWWTATVLPSCNRLTSFLLGLIIGGAIGNLYDRLAFAGVRDFIQVYLWGGYPYPTFNLADSFMVVSVCVIALTSIRMQPSAEPSRAPQKV